MSNKVKTLRSSVAGTRPADGTRQIGELYVNFADKQLGTIDQLQNHQDLLAVKIYSDTGVYVAGDFATYLGNLYKATSDILVPEAFNQSNWVAMQEGLGLGTAGQMLATNTAEDNVEWVDPSGGGGIFNVVGERNSSLSTNLQFAFGNGSTTSDYSIAYDCILDGISFSAASAITAAAELEILVNGVASGVKVTVANGTTEARATGFNLAVSPGDVIKYKANSGSGGSATTVTAWFLTDGAKGDKGDPGTDGTHGLPGTPGLGYGNLSKVFQTSDTVGGMSLTTTPQPIAFNLDYIKDDYYIHDTVGDPTVVEVVNDGLYKFSGVVVIATVGSAAGTRGNPVLNVELNRGGAGFVDLPGQIGGYIREDANNALSCTLSSAGLLSLLSGDKLRVTVHDTVNTPPDEATVGYGSKAILEFIDRTGLASGTVDNLKDIGDVNAPAPLDGMGLAFNTATSKWVPQEIPWLNTDGTITNKNDQKVVITASGVGVAGVTITGTQGGLFDGDYTDSGTTDLDGSIVYTSVAGNRIIKDADDKAHWCIATGTSTVNPTHAASEYVNYVTNALIGSYTGIGTNVGYVGTGVYIAGSVDYSLSATGLIQVGQGVVFDDLKHFVGWDPDNGFFVTGITDVDSGAAYVVRTNGVARLAIAVPGPGALTQFYRSGAFGGYLNGSEDPNNDTDGNNLSLFDMTFVDFNTGATGTVAKPDVAIGGGLQVIDGILVGELQSSGSRFKILPTGITKDGVEIVYSVKTVDGVDVNGSGNIDVLSRANGGPWDWNTVTTAGVYRGNGSTANRPTSYNGYESVFVYTPATTSNYIVQTAVGGAGDALATRRSNDDGVTWSTWKDYGDVDGPGASTDSNFALYSGTTGKLLKDASLKLNDSGTTVSDMWSASKITSAISAGGGTGDVTGPSSSTINNLPVFSATTGKFIGDSGVSISAVTANTAKVTNATHTGQVTGDTVLTIAAGTVSNNNLENMAADTIKGKTTSGGAPEDLSATQVRSIIGNTTAQWNANQLQGRTVATTAPSDGQVLTYDTTNGWQPETSASGGMINPMTTQGDTIYGGTSGTPTRLAKGTAAQVLTMNAGATAPEWADAGGGSGGVTMLTGTGTITGTVSTNTNVTGTATITGAVVGDVCAVNPANAATANGKWGLIFCWVSAANTVSWTIRGFDWEDTTRTFNIAVMQ